MFPVVYERATTPTSGPAPGARALMAWALSLTAPHGENLGIYNRRGVGSTATLSTHAEGRAIDVGVPVVRPDGHPTGWLLARLLVEHHDQLGVQQVIFAKKIWRNTRASEGWRPYSVPAGGSEHFDHVHAELTRAAAAGLTSPMIAAAVEETTVPTDPKNPYTAEVNEALALLAEHAGYTGKLDGWFGPGALAALHRLKIARVDAGAAAEALRVERDRLQAELRSGGRLPALLAAMDAAMAEARK